MSLQKKSSFLCFYIVFLLSPFPLYNKALLAPPQFTNRGPLSARQRRMMGKWVFCHQRAPPPLLYVASVFSQMRFPFERKMPTRVRSVGAARYPNRWHPEDQACQCVTMETGRMTGISRGRLPSCLLFPHLPPSPVFTTCCAPTCCGSAGQKGLNYAVFQELVLPFFWHM